MSSRTILKAKIHRATVTDADLHYEGSITIDAALCRAAGLVEFEQVDVYDIDNGHRFTTYVILGGAGEICVNGAAARLVQRGDKVIIASYCPIADDGLDQWRPTLVMVRPDNAIDSVQRPPVRRP